MVQFLNTSKTKSLGWALSFSFCDLVLFRDSIILAQLDQYDHLFIISVVNFFANSKYLIDDALFFFASFFFRIYNISFSAIGLTKAVFMYGVIFLLAKTEVAFLQKIRRF